MLDTLDARLAQARAGQLGHLEFLQVLCHDEIARRDAAAIDRRTRRARFEQTLTLEGFDFAANPKLPAAQIRDLAALRWMAGGESVILHGPVGVGKTHDTPARLRAGAASSVRGAWKLLTDALASARRAGAWLRATSRAAPTRALALRARPRRTVPPRPARPPPRAGHLSITPHRAERST